MTPEQYYASHQNAFRIAFNFLNAHFPPGEEPEWWEQASNDMLEASKSTGQLGILLLIAVFDYLNDEYKRRTQNGSAEN